jgi:hypothetical protein
VCDGLKDTDRKKTNTTDGFAREMYIMKFTYHEIFLLLLKAGKITNDLQSPMMFIMLIKPPGF